MDMHLIHVISSRLVWLLLLSFSSSLCMSGQEAIDSDRDGLPDALEEKLLLKFQPAFMLGTQDCSALPAEFQRETPQAVVSAENGTVYGQAFPVKRATGTAAVEMHYYLLWKTDCGRHGHPLDAEHVSVLLQAPQDGESADDWRALYWYAAAHESTVCDVSQIARSTTLHAETSGPTVWISPGKHASYLVHASCQAGCGADRCLQMTRLKVAALVNLGEVGAPMNGSNFTVSRAWPLADKMSQSNFPAGTLARLNALPPDDLIWYNPGRHPAQGIIAISSHTEEHLANAGASTSSALETANDATAAGLSTAKEHTGAALGKSYRSVKRALGSSAKHVGEALHPRENDQQKSPPPQ